MLEVETWSWFGQLLQERKINKGRTTCQRKNVIFSNAMKVSLMEGFGGNLGGGALGRTKAHGVWSVCGRSGESKVNQTVDVLQ